MRYNSRTLKQVLVVAVAIAVGSTGVYAAGSAGDIIAARQAHYKDIGKAFKAINDQLKSATPDLAVIKANAPTVTRLGQQQYRETWFPVGTQAGQGLQTGANAAIWNNPADFNAKRADFSKASATYADIAAKGDLAAIAAATLAVAKTCKGCHETDRDKDKS